MAIEKYIALASLGLMVMFCGEIFVFYHYLISPTIEVDPESQILMYISIGVAPGLSLVGTVFAMSMRYGSKPAGAIIIGAGVALLVGMVIANMLVPQIDKNYQVYTVQVVPKIFMAVSVAVMASGALLFRTKTRPRRVF